MATVSDSPLDLLRPDPPTSSQTEEEDDADLDALRAAALASMMKPKIKPHPDRSNLLCIVAHDEKVELSEESFEEEEEVETETEVEVTDSDYEIEIPQESAIESSITRTPSMSATDANTSLSKDDDVLHVDCPEEVDEFSKFLNEFESELNDKPAKKAQPVKLKSDKKKTKVIKKKKLVKRLVKKRKKVKLDDTTTTTATSHSHVTDRGYRRSFSRSPSPYRYNRRYSRSPVSPYRYGRRSRSPCYRRPESPYRRSYSPLPNMRYPPPPIRRPGYISPPRGPFHKRSSPPRAYSRSPSPSFRRHRSPQRLRFEPRPFKPARRGDSAPRASENDPQRRTKNIGNHVKDGAFENDLKSKSLPPQDDKEKLKKQKEEEEAEKKRKEEEEKKKLEEEKEKEFQERLKRLPTPDREKVLARRRKFESVKSVDPEKKVIVLKSKDESPKKTDSKPIVRNSEGPPKARRMTSEDAGESISLSVDDTLDMFDEDEKETRKRPLPIGARISIPNKVEPSKDITDLRLRLHKKRQQNRDVPSEDSLENAVLDTSEDLGEEKPIPPRNRIVKPPSHEEDRRLVVTSLPKRSESPKKTGLYVIRKPSTNLRPSLMSRLGEQIPDEYSEPEEVPEEAPEEKIIRKRKITSSDQSDSSDTPIKISKKDKKKDKKEKKEKEKKKKAKKEKKEKKEKRKKRKSKASESLSEAEVEVKQQVKGDSSDEELWQFFENLDRKEDQEPKKVKVKAEPAKKKENLGAIKASQGKKVKEKKKTVKIVSKHDDVIDVDAKNTPDKTDILLDKMRKKNEAVRRRLREIEEDKKMHR